MPRDPLLRRRRERQAATAHQELGLTIKRARERAGMTQQEMADKLGVVRETVGAWEYGRQFPGRKAGAIEALLNITIPAKPAA